MGQGQGYGLRLNSAQREGLAIGLRDVMASLIAVGTWGLVTGIAIVKSGVPENVAALMSVLVYAGSAQLTALPLIESGAPLWLIFAAGFVVNIRFIVFGAALQPYFQHFSWPRRFWLSLLISDMGFVLFLARYSEDKCVGTTQQLWYFLGAGVPIWFLWTVGMLAGVYMGGFVPASWSLDFAAILALLAIVIPLVKTQPMVMCLVVAGTVAWFGQVLPLQLGLAVAVVAGVFAGVAGERLALRQREGK